MNPPQADLELLLRYLEGRVSTGERAVVVEMLRTDATARAFVRTVSEHAVQVADLERTAASRAEALNAGAPRALKEKNPEPILRPDFRRWMPRVLIAAGVLFLIALALGLRPNGRTGQVRVARATGLSRYFGSQGALENARMAGLAGITVGAGDTLETRSCDAWIDLKLRDGTMVTLGGNSTLRLLNGDSGRQQFELSRGSLWVNPSSGTRGERVQVQTPALQVEVKGAQFDVQTSPTESIVRLNEGSGQVTRNLDGGTVTLAKGQQASSSLRRNVPLAASAQPAPIDFWACNLGTVPEVILGRWLPSTPAERARLGAEPLLWPISQRDSIMLYAAALAAWKSSEHPVVLHADSKLQFRGRTEREHTVRFGFSAQKIRGVFAGKFEIDVPAASLGKAGETWEVELSLADFRPLYPQLAATPEGLELTDVYALTVRDDAGLELNHIELRPAK